MAARKLRSLVTHLESLQDPRLERTRKHHLLDIIALTIGAVRGRFLVYFPWA